MKTPYRAVEFIVSNAPLYAKAKSERIYLEEFRKSKKALLMKDAMVAGFDSAASQEREAYAHPDYKQLLVGLAIAIEKEETLKWQLMAAQMKTEIWRTESANERMQDKSAQ
ncbi:hypothetical protein UFOVP306_56 [uncultured Caudovirales phage]|uniref:Uncharacterized protein n=1 Tax=uncultured Caudovirales phage TaxID=2100421 RepID=A0A6J5LUI1_9CAUD|nr:hypothetical protein UFOVP306_56 [uncultured Caudovirales phage]